MFAPQVQVPPRSAQPGGGKYFRPKMASSNMIRSRKARHEVLERRVYILGRGDAFRPISDAFRQPTNRASNRYPAHSPHAPVHIYAKRNSRVQDVSGLTRPDPSDGSRLFRQHDALVLVVPNFGAPMSRLSPDCARSLSDRHRARAPHGSSDRDYPEMRVC